MTYFSLTHRWENTKEENASKNLRHVSWSPIINRNNYFTIQKGPVCTLSDPQIRCKQQIIIFPLTPAPLNIKNVSPPRNIIEFRLKRSLLMSNFGRGLNALLLPILYNHAGRNEFQSHNSDLKKSCVPSNQVTRIL